MTAVKMFDGADRRAIDRLVARPLSGEASMSDRVGRIVADVRRRGDRAVKAYARQLDGMTGSLEIGREEIAAGAHATPAPVRRALREAGAHIRKVARAQLPRSWSTQVAPGVVVEQRVTPLDRVGCYVPGGRFPLPSSLLMTAVPARIAGVREVIACCPKPAPVVLAAAAEAGIDRLFRVGGAHAIAALAYGTATIPQVDKIVGPGSRYVAEAKALVVRDCAIDFYAGPSEIVIVSSAAPATWIAADMLAQAEHDPDARAVFITTRPTLARAVLNAIEQRMPATGPARASLATRGAIIVVKTRDEAIALADRFVPEHLVCDDDEVASRVRAGTVFVGPWSAQAAGDYGTGSNHVLPTSGAARFRGGLSAADFVRVSSVQRLTRTGLKRIGQTIITLAEAEGLTAHAESIRERLR
ncbi:MAG: histidinol dehydrogenase [Acidobacteriota bacterium]